MDINIVIRAFCFSLVSVLMTPFNIIHAATIEKSVSLRAVSDGTPLKKVLAAGHASKNLLDPNAWRPWQKGFERRNDVFICDNASNTQVQRGISQTIAINQTKPEPIVAVAWSKADAVRGGRDSDYSLYLDLVYSDGSPLWGQVAPFNVGTHDWEKAQVIVFPDKPIKSVSFHMLLRRHPGKAWFRNPELRVLKPPAGACLFDGVPVSLSDYKIEDFQVRDVVCDSDFVRFERRAMGLELEYHQEQKGKATFFDVTISDTTGKDRAITLIYAIPAPIEK
ncbi:MAG: hypothetical protein JSW47_19275, partial [Phycisphaerales bacterium]